MSPSSAPSQMETTGHNSPPVSMMTALVRAHADTWPDTNSLDYSWYAEPVKGGVEMTGNSTPQPTDPVDMDQVRQFFSLLTSCLDVIKAWAVKVPGFTELCKEDQELLFQSACLELLVIRLAYRTRPGDQQLVFDNRVVLHRSQCRPCFGQWQDAIEDFAQSFQSLDVDVSAFSSLMALILVTDRYGLCEPQRVESLQMKIITALRDHVTYNPEAQRKPHYFSRLLSKLPELRSLSIQGLQRIFYLKVEDLAAAPPLLEAIFSSSLPF